MAITITYDIPKEHREFKNQMFKRGFVDQIPGVTNCKVIYFPNTTRYHSTKNASEAVSDAINICKSLGIELERCVATQWALIGKPYAVNLLTAK